MASPMPCAAPVTIATLFSSFMGRSESRPGYHQASGDRNESQRRPNNLSRNQLSTPLSIGAGRTGWPPELVLIGVPDCAATGAGAGAGLPQGGNIEASEDVPARPGSA